MLSKSLKGNVSQRFCDFFLITANLRQADLEISNDFQQFPMVVNPFVKRLRCVLIF